MDAATNSADTFLARAICVPSIRPTKRDPERRTRRQTALEMVAKERERK